MLYEVITVSDAGMPCVSDPGAKLVQYCIENSLEYDVIPGANAVLTAFAMSGFENTEFTFFGFLPHKGKERQINRITSYNVCYTKLLRNSLPLDGELLTSYVKLAKESLKKSPTVSELKKRYTEVEIIHPNGAKENLRLLEDGNLIKPLNIETVALLQDYDLHLYS